MKSIIKKVLALLVLFAMISGLAVHTFAATPFEHENEINILFFGGEGAAQDAASSESISYTYEISKYVSETYNKEHANVINTSGSYGFKHGYYSIDEYGKPAIAFISFTANETKEEMAFAEGIVRKLYDKNNLVIVNFILLPNGDAEANVSKITELADYYGIYVHNIRRNGEILNRYSKFNFDELFASVEKPNDDGHNVISRMIVNNLKTENWYNSLKWKDNAIYAEIIDAFPETELGEELTKEEIFLSTDGNDENSGTIENPICSVERLIELIAEKPENTDIAVYFREGTYGLENGVVLDNENTKNKKISFCTYNGEKAILTSAVKIENSLFKKVTDDAILKRLPKEARGRVLELNLNKLGIKDEDGFVRHGIWQYTPSALQLIVDNKLQSVSRWPNNGFEQILSPSAREITVSTDRIERWETATECWLYGYLGNYFADDSIKITKINTKAKTIAVANNPRYAFAANHSWSVINLLEEIDVPGEWFLDHKTNILYYFPVDDFENKEVRISEKKDTLFTLSETKDISFKDLIFEGTRSMAFEIKNCENTVIENCEIRNTGRNAVSLSGKNNSVKNTYIHDTGRGGIFVSGGDIEKLTPSNNVIENCRIENVCNYARTYVPAIQLYGVGNRASHNQISHGLGIAIDIGTGSNGGGSDGINNIIEYNDISNWLYEGGDIGIIYSGRTWTSGGNVIRYNYIHGSPGAGDVQAIYLDDGMIGAIIYGNVFENVTRGIYIHFGSYHQIRNNVFTDCDTAIVIRNALGITDQAAENANKSLEDAFKNGSQNTFDLYGFQTRYSEWVKEYVPNSAVYDRLFPYMKNAPYAGLFVPKDNVFERNIYACKTDYNMSDTMAQNQIFKDNYTLTKEELETFNLSDINDVYASKIPGFIPIDITKAGKKDKPEIDNIELLSPLDNITNVEARNVKFSWNRVSAATKYRLVIALDEDFKELAYSGESDKNKSYANIEGLKYGSKKYYWKIIAYDDYGNARESGVYSFTTAAKEIVDKTMLREMLNRARTLYDNSVEGDEPGQTMAGAKDIFEKYIEAANGVFASRSATQKSIDKTCEILSTQIKQFNASKNYKIAKTNIYEMLSHQNAWSSTGDIHSFKDERLKILTNGCLGYMGRTIDSDEVLKFKLTLSDVDDSKWISFGVRAQNPLVQPWNTPCYVFLVKESVIELQKFNSGKSFYFSIDNDYLKNDTEYEVEFGAVTTGDGESVRIYLTVDGQTLFDYIDAEFQVDKTGYFSVYSAGGKADIAASDDE